MSGSVKPGSVL